MADPTKLVIFDCDGTLADSDRSIIAAIRGAFADVGLPTPTLPEIRANVGLSLDAFLAGVLEEPLSEADAEKLGISYRLYFKQLREEHGPDPLFEGLREVLESLSARGVLLGVATGKSRRGLKHWIDAQGLAPLFVTLQTADDAPSKPHPGMILQAMAEADATPEHTLMIGDTSFDIEAARAARARGIGVSWGYHSSEALHAAGAIDVVDSAEALSQRIDASLGL